MQQQATDDDGGGAMRVIGGIIVLIVMLGAAYFIYRKATMPASGGASAGAGAGAAGGASDPLTALENQILSPDYDSNENIGGPTGTNTGTDKVGLFSDCNYSGSTAMLGVGSYNMAAMVAAGIKNDTLSSLQIPAGFEVTLYRDDNYKGDSVILKYDTSCLVDVKMGKGGSGWALLSPLALLSKGKTWNDQTSSLKIVNTNVNASVGLT